MKEFNLKIQVKFNQMQKSGKLFRVSLEGSKIWELYLNSFTKEQNPTFRSSETSTFGCNTCNSFVRRYGNIVSINDDYEIETIFDVEVEKNSEYYNVTQNLTKAIKASKIVNVFFETFDSLNKLPYEVCKKTNNVFQLGIVSNVKRYTKEEAEMYGVVKPDEIRTFNHFALKVDKQFVDQSGKSAESLMSEYRSDFDVFKRSMNDVNKDTYTLMIDLINQDSLRNSNQYVNILKEYVKHKSEFETIVNKDNYCWVKSYNYKFAKFLGTLQGEFLKDVEKGEDLNYICLTYNKRIDPANFMKATAAFTPRQKQEAINYITENGFVESFNRRFATINDINVSQILHSNVGNGKFKTASIFDNIKATKVNNTKNNFDGIQEVNIETFMKDILPTCSSVEAYLTSLQESNLCSLTTSAENSKQMFKWNNPFSITFGSNFAGQSMIKEAVKTAGGKVDGVMRFSIMWADGDGDNSDLDAHCEESSGTHISYSNKRSSYTEGNLDIDIQTPNGKLAVENITYPTLSKIKNGTYKYYVHQYSNRGSKGFAAEVEINGETYTYIYNKPVNGNVHVAEVTVKNGEFSIKHILPVAQSVTKELYGLNINEFHKVNLVCLSPSHWAEDNVGNLHYLFMLENAKSPTSIRSFHSENLLPELAAMRKVLEVLGSTNMIESTDNQLSGLGYNSTVRNELVLKLTGSYNRVIKIKF